MSGRGIWLPVAILFFCCWRLWAAEEAEEMVQRARQLQSQGQRPAALAAYDAVIGRWPTDPLYRQERGMVRMLEGQFAGAVADFDFYLQAYPERRPHHWQRGICYYYLGDFARGRAQFELHQTVNGDDVENAIWHFMCVTRQSTLATAREKMLPCGEDGRPPMATLYALFSGAVGPEAVVAAIAKETTPGRQRVSHFYGNLYLGIYFDLVGDSRRAEEHLKLAATTHYLAGPMGDIARIHLKLVSDGAAKGARPIMPQSAETRPAD